jgi:hypothetical protein
MNITMLQSVSSLAGSFSCKKSYDLPDNLATQWIAAGYAKATVSEVAEVKVAPAPIVEVAAVAEKPVVTSSRKSKATKSDLL